MTRYLALVGIALANLIGMGDWSFAAQRPNILWIVTEDTSPWMGCYEDPINAGATSHIDSLATEGIRFSRAFVPAAVCSACRSALMGGESQIRFNAHEHLSSRGPAKIHLPAGMKQLPQLIKDSGYFTFNLGKTDYNFVWDAKSWRSITMPFAKMTISSVRGASEALIEIDSIAIE